MMDIHFPPHWTPEQRFKFGSWVAEELAREALASGIEAPSGGETTEIGSTVGESPARDSGDAQTPSPSGTNQ